MGLYYGIVAECGVVERQAVVLRQQVGEQELPDSHGDGHDGAARVDDAGIVRIRDISLLDSKNGVRLKCRAFYLGVSGVG